MKMIEKVIYFLFIKFVLKFFFTIFLCLLFSLYYGILRILFIITYFKYFTKLPV